MEETEERMVMRERKGDDGGRRRSTCAASKGSAALEGEIAVEVDLRLLELATATDAGLLVGATSPGIAKGAFAIELLFQAAKGLIDRFPAFESDFNHERKTLSESGAEGKSGFLPLFLVGLGKAGGFLWKKEKEESD